MNPKLFKLIPTEIPDYNSVLKNWSDRIIPGSSFFPAKTPIRDQFRTNEVIVKNVPSHIEEAEFLQHIQDIYPNDTKVIRIISRQTKATISLMRLSITDETTKTDILTNQLKIGHLIYPAEPHTET
jgi:hypothetical protein